MAELPAGLGAARAGGALVALERTFVRALGDDAARRPWLYELTPPGPASRFSRALGGVYGDNGIAGRGLLYGCAMRVTLLR